MHMDPIMPVVVGTLLIILLMGLILQRFRQPYVVGYLFAGVILGPFGWKLFTDTEAISHLGTIGVMLLLFFIGMEISLTRLLANWRIAVLGTLSQIVISVFIVWILGLLLHWSLARSVLLGFVISLSSTAVVLKILQDWKALDTPVGQDVLGVLLVQDLALIPMLIVLQLLGGELPSANEIGLQLFGGVLFIGVFILILRSKEVRLPLRKVREDHEMQVFAAFVLCFGLAFITSLLGLSSALGAFMAGIVVGTARETQWVHRSLQPFHVVFVALFFVSVGMLLDLDFLLQQAPVLISLVVIVFLINTFINAGILRMLGRGLKTSLYSGAMLAQIGEFSFILAAVGLQSNIINEFAFQTTISVITLTLMLSPIWILLFRHYAKH